MGKLEPFDKKQTNWEGLWYHPEYSGYSSACISLANLRKFKGNVRLYVRKNKFYNNGENGRPNYHFCLKDADAEVFQTLEVDEGESKYDLISKLADVMVEGNLNGNVMMLPSESIARANELMKQAISLVEQLTGETWNFTALTF